MTMVARQVAIRITGLHRCWPARLSVNSYPSLVLLAFLLCLGLSLDHTHHLPPPRPCRQLEGLDLRFSTDSPDERVREECCPGAPYVQYRAEPSVPLVAVNPQPGSGLFQVRLAVREGDTPRRIANRLARTERAVKGQWDGWGGVVWAGSSQGGWW